MTARRTARSGLAVAALALAGLAPGARADEGHLLTATCDALTVPSPTRVVVATARAEGHARVVSTEIVCTTEWDQRVLTTFRQAVPGPAAVTGGVVEAYPLFALHVCVQATAYWSDGHVLVTDTRCGYGGTSVQAAS